MGRSPCCSKQGLNRGAWTKEEDMILSTYIQTHGDGGWKILPQKAGLNRCGKSCRLRWMNYLRPDIKRGRISADEEDLIIRMHRLLGNRWSLIAGRLPGRTDNEIKNYWNTQLSKKLPPLKQSQANSSTKSLETKWRSSSPLPTRVFKAIPLKITTAMRGSGIVRENSYNSDGCNNSSLNGSLKSCNINETGNFSQSCCDLLANNSITPDDSERIAFQRADANFVEAEFVDEESPHSDHCGGNTAILEESLLDFSDLSLPRWNRLFSSSDCDTDFGLEELYRGAAMELNEFEDFMCSDQNIMEKVNSFEVVANQGIDLCDSKHAYCIDEVIYLQETKKE